MYRQHLPLLLQQLLLLLLLLMCLLQLVVADVAGASWQPVGIPFLADGGRRGRALAAAKKSWKDYGRRDPDRWKVRDPGRWKAGTPWLLGSG